MDCPNMQTYSSQENDRIMETTAWVTLQRVYIWFDTPLSIKLKVENVKTGTKLLSQFILPRQDNDEGCSTIVLSLDTRVYNLTLGTNHVKHHYNYITHTMN